MRTTADPVRSHRLHIHQVAAAGADTHTRLAEGLVYRNVGQHKITDSIGGIVGIIAAGCTAVFIEDADRDTCLGNSVHAVQAHLGKIKIFLAKQAVRLQVILNANRRCTSGDAVALVVELCIEVDALAAVLTDIDIGVEVCIRIYQREIDAIPYFVVEDGIVDIEIAAGIDLAAVLQPGMQIG